MRKEKSDGPKLILAGHLPEEKTVFKQDKEVWARGGVSPCIRCSGRQVQVAEGDMRKIELYGLLPKSTRYTWDHVRRVYKTESISPALNTCGGGGIEVKIAVKDDGVYADNEKVRIRRLTPREYFRLQGVKDEDFEKVAKNQSDSSLYHLAGDSICVDVLMAIFAEMFPEEG